MRPYSAYLDYMKKENRNVKLFLAGSTPPIPDFLQKKQIQFNLDPSTYHVSELKLREQLAAMAKTTADRVCLMPGSTQACFQALAAVTKPGDTLLLEYPAYEPYLATADFLGLKVKRFQRSDDLEIDLAEIKKQSIGAKVLLISNPHCPTGWTYDPASLKKLSSLKLHVIIDEVFLPLFSKGSISHNLCGPFPGNFIFLSGLSKPTGLGLFRGGWTIASAKVTEKISQMGLHLHIDFPMPIIPVMEVAFKQWQDINSYLQKMADQNRGYFQKIYKEDPKSLSHDFSKGFFGMLKAPPSLKTGKAAMKKALKDGVCLRDGAHFEMPKWVRFHILLGPGPFRDLKKSLEGLGY